MKKSLQNANTYNWMAPGWANYKTGLVNRRADGSYDNEAATARIKRANDLVLTEQSIKTKAVRDHLEDRRIAKEFGLNVADFI
jgi:hypothetical protein